MKFIETLRLKSKLFFLFLLVTLGLFGIGIAGIVNINGMKKNIDTLYFGSLIPVIELNNILRIYNNDLVVTLYKVKNTQIPKRQAESDIQNSIYKIKKIWREYNSHYKTDEEVLYLEYASKQLEDTNSYFYKILQASIDGKDLKKLSMKSLEKQISAIDKTIQKIINYETDVAKSQRRMFLVKYNMLLQRLGAIFVLIIIFVMVIFFYVFKSIQNDNTQLQKASKKLKKLNKELENASYTDTLTNLHNRRYFNFIYNKELKRAKRERHFITFMMLDIDFFKQYNDTYGHIEGDHALKSVAKVLKDILNRPSDFVFRLGGEEFAVLFSGVNESQSARIAQHICDTIKGREILHENSKIDKYLTISIGLVCCIADNSLDEKLLISKADEMLYKAKEGGRNRYAISSTVSEALTTAS